MNRFLKRGVLYTLLALMLPGALAVMVYHSRQRPLLSDSARENDQIPDDLYRTYERFARALKAGDCKRIEEMCVPRSVRVITTPRPKEKENWGDSINIPFATKGFQSEVIFAYDAGKGAFFIHTSTTGIWFIETKHAGWMVYRYNDADYLDLPAMARPPSEANTGGNS